MPQEFHDLQKQRWILVPPTLHQTIHGCWWMIKIKVKNNSIVAHKAHLIVKATNESKELTILKHSIQLLKRPRIHILITTAHNHNQNILQLLTGFQDPQYSDHNYLLKKIIYKLKPALHQWLSTFLVISYNMDLFPVKSIHPFIYTNMITSEYDY